MEKRLGLKDFAVKNCKTEAVNGSDSFIIDFKKKDEQSLNKQNSDTFNLDGGNGGLELSGKPGHLAGIEWSKVRYFAADMTNHEDSIMSVLLNFWDESNTGEKPDVVVVTGLMPGLKTKVTLPFADFAENGVHLKRTPGRATTLLWGKRLDPARINRFSISSAMGAPSEWYPERRLEISNICFTDKEIDEYPVADMKYVDELGQQAHKDWPGKMHGVDELKKYLGDEFAKPADIGFFENWSRYGGFREIQFEATGYFRTHFDGERWWIVDPDGYAFFSTGLNCIATTGETKTTKMEPLFSWLPDRDGEFKACWRISDQLGRGGPDYNISTYNFLVSNLIRAFGSNWWAGWSKFTRRRLVEWGFNTVGNWSLLDFIKKADLPYVWPLKGFPETKKCIYRDFPDVFSPEYQASSDKFAEELKPFKGDRYLIGYFMRNEPMWALQGGEYVILEMLGSDTSFCSRDEFVKFLSGRYNGDIDKFNKTWNVSLTGFEQLDKKVEGLSKISAAARKDIKDFADILIDRYVRLPAEALKKVDPDHMNMGMRYSIVSDECLRNALIACDLYDVFSINVYKFNPYNELEKVGKRANMPVLIGEYCFGALDRGLWEAGLKGVPTQGERGKAYRHYVENAAISKYCVGTHYFLYNDQPLVGRSDGENFQIGCVDVCNRPYKEYIDEVTQTNRTIYDVICGKRKAYDVMPRTDMKL